MDLSLRGAGGDEAIFAGRRLLRGVYPEPAGGPAMTPLTAFHGASTTTTPPVVVLH